MTKITPSFRTQHMSAYNVLFTLTNDWACPIERSWPAALARLEVEGSLLARSLAADIMVAVYFCRWFVRGGGWGPFRGTEGAACHLITLITSNTSHLDHEIRFAITPKAILNAKPNSISRTLSTSFRSSSSHNESNIASISINKRNSIEHIICIYISASSSSKHIIFS